MEYKEAKNKGSITVCAAGKGLFSYFNGFKQINSIHNFI